MQKQFLKLLLVNIIAKKARFRIYLKESPLQAILEGLTRIKSEDRRMGT